MGQSKESTMKSFAFVCLFAAAYAAPEADPALLYSSLGYGFHHPYTYGAYAPYAVPAVHSAAVKSVVETPAEVKTTVHAAPVVYSGVHHAAVAAPVVYNTAAHVAAPVVHTACYYSGYHHPYAYSGFRRFYGGFPYTAYNRG